MRPEPGTHRWHVSKPSVEDARRRVEEFEERFGLSSDEFYEAYLRGEHRTVVGTAWATYYRFLLQYEEERARRRMPELPFLEHVTA